MVKRQFTHSSTFANGDEYVLIEGFSIPIATVLFNGDLSRKNVFISGYLVAQFSCGNVNCAAIPVWIKSLILTIHMKVMNHGAEVRSLTVLLLIVYCSNHTSPELLCFWNRGWFTLSFFIWFCKTDKHYVVSGFVCVTCFQAEDLVI